MDGNILDTLKKARQNYWDVKQCNNALADEQGREPKPRPKAEVGGGGAWLLRAGFFGMLLFFGAGGVGWAITGKVDFIGVFLCLCTIIASAIALEQCRKEHDKVTTEKKKKKEEIDAAYQKYLEWDFTKEIQRWQDCLHEKKRALDDSWKRYCHYSAILPPKYSAFNYEYNREHPVVAITQYFEDLRADTIKDAINLYEADERDTKRDSENAAHRWQMEQYAAKQTRMAEEAADAAKRGADAAEREADAAKRGADAAERMERELRQNLYK